MPAHHSLNYLEVPTTDLSKTKAFFKQAFGWDFVDYGPDYSCFTGQSIDGGFFSAEAKVDAQQGAPLLVLYSNNLDASQKDVLRAGGKIVKPVFAFPGGQRFHFCDPANNEFAIWSE